MLTDRRTDGKANEQTGIQADRQTGRQADTGPDDKLYALKDEN